MKKLYTMVAALLVCGVVYAAQDTDVTNREVRDPKKLETWLETNASDAETRIAVLETSLGTNVANEAVTILGLTVSGDLDVGTNAAVGGTLGVTGVATFTAESVHNGGIDADYLTVDAAAGVDTKTAGKLVIGAATATSLDLGAADIDTTVLGPLNVLEATGKGIDTTGAGALYLGEAVATSVVLGASDANTTVAGDLTVSGLDIDSAAGAMTVGKAAATSLALGAADITTTVSGPLVVSGAALWLGTNGYFEVVDGVLNFVGHNGFTNAVDADITQ